MKVRVFVLILLGLLSALRAEDAPAFRRFALVAGTNDGGLKRVKLRYAHSDATAFAGVLTELGGVRAQDLLVLQSPTRKEFLAALDRMREAIRAAGGRGRVELLVYYSGHSDETGLLLGEEKLRYEEFRSRIDDVPAKIKLAVVDACASGALTRLKGGQRLPAFALDQSSSLSGYAFLTSSSGNEAAQESDRIRASFFTHYLVTGLRGAADLNADRKVTLSEAYEFAFHETLSQTEGSQSGAQHPSYDMRLTGSGDLVLTDLRGTSAGLVLDGTLRGRLFVRAPSGALVAELQKHAGRTVELGLEPGMYDMRLDQGDAYYRGLVKVDPLSHHPLALGDFEPAPREATLERGEAWRDAGAAIPPSAYPPPARAEETLVPIRAALVPSLGIPGWGPGPWAHNLSLNLLAGDAGSIEGLQLSLLVSRSRERMDGLQMALFNRADGSARGLQIGALGNHAPGSLKGAQIALVNAGRRTDGLQAGLINATGGGRGLQAGAVNAAARQSGLQAGIVNAVAEGSGMQAGLLNAAGTFHGLQAGLLNIAAESHGVVLGPLNFIGNGIHGLESVVDEKSMLRTALLLGGKYNYTWYSFDMKAVHPYHLWGGSAGLGVQYQDSILFAGFDAGAGALWNETWGTTSVTGRLRWLAGIRPLRYVSAFFGLSFNLEGWESSDGGNLNPDVEGDRWNGDVRGKTWAGIFMGVRLW